MRVVPTYRNVSVRMIKSIVFELELGSDDFMRVVPTCGEEWHRQRMECEPEHGFDEGCAHQCECEFALDQVDSV